MFSRKRCKQECPTPRCDKEQKFLLGIFPNARSNLRCRRPAGCGAGQNGRMFQSRNMKSGCVDFSYLKMRFSHDFSAKLNRGFQSSVCIMRFFLQQ
ncbi:hypothetical protein [Burkholderia lata]|uniref:hypothetical protein n=1 Tax=Burkholderia lata (strain ATCC 17760 / DSM 23089 / LMG 22485 / NCIMB 9086 / R18194 / 383) TaxID=482957 RepID=UPI0015840F17|nr:hypothetical protein [Burkholderia lata]